MAWLSYRLKPACSSTGTRPNGWQASCSGYFHERAPRGAATQTQGPTRLSLSTKISKTTPCKVAWWSLAWMLGAIPRNILTRRANQRHYSIIAQFEKRPWPCPTRGSSARLQAKNPYPQLKLHRLAEVASARHSEGSPLALASRARLPCACPRRYRREHSSRPQQGNGLGRWQVAPWH